MSDVKIKIAKHKETGELVHIDNSKRGKECNCICTKCGNDLIAKKGEVI